MELTTNGTNYIGIKAQTNLSKNYTYILPNNLDKKINILDVKVDELDDDVELEDELDDEFNDEDEEEIELEEDEYYEE